jgi:hypothetical protein
LTRQTVAHHDVRELVLLDAVPDADQVAPARLENARGLGEGARLVREEHRPELAHHHVEHAVGERQHLGIRLPPGDPVRRELARCMVEHRPVEVGRDDGDVPRQGGHQGARDHASSGSGFEHASVPQVCQPGRQIIRVRREDHRP